MKLTAENFLKLLEDNSISFIVQSNKIFFTNGDSELIKKLYALIDDKPECEAAVIRHMNNQQGMSLQEFMTDLQGAGVHVELVDTYTLNFTGGKDKSRERLAGILERDNRLKAALILSLAAKNKNFLDVIQECACNRWCDGYSDSLLMAVLCNLTHTGETVERNPNGEIVLQPKTDWDKEIASL